MLAASVQSLALTAASPTVFVTNVAELYMAVNDSGKAGVVVALAPGLYAHDPSYANGGRLELQPDMTFLTGS